MKFKVDIDCTPDEARAFFGLPDVKPLQEALLPEVEERLRERRSRPWTRRRC